MKVTEVIEMVTKRGMHFEPAGNHFLIKGKTENMTDKLRELIEAYKPQIYAHYGIEFDEPSEYCPQCGGRIMQ